MTLLSSIGDLVQGLRRGMIEADSVHAFMVRRMTSIIEQAEGTCLRADLACATAREERMRSQRRRTQIDHRAPDEMTAARLRRILGCRHRAAEGRSAR